MSKPVRAAASRKMVNTIGGTCSNSSRRSYRSCSTSRRSHIPSCRSHNNSNIPGTLEKHRQGDWYIHKVDVQEEPVGLNARCYTSLYHPCQGTSPRDRFYEGVFALRQFTADPQTIAKLDEYRVNPDRRRSGKREKVPCPPQKTS